MFLVLLSKQHIDIAGKQFSELSFQILKQNNNKWMVLKKK